jgi:hypothetical protein
LCWVNLATYLDTSPYLSPLIFVLHYTLIPSNPEEPIGKPIHKEHGSHLKLVQQILN